MKHPAYIPCQITSKSVTQKHVLLLLNLISSYICYRFERIFGLNKTAFKFIFEKIEPHLTHLTGSNRASGLPKLTKLAATLKILVKGYYKKGTDEDDNDYMMNLSYVAVKNAFSECIEVLHDEICPKWITYDMNEREKQEIKDSFYAIAKFPGVIGCLTNTHVKILSPNILLYVNKQKYNSLNVMMVI